MAHPFRNTHTNGYCFVRLHHDLIFYDTIFILKKKIQSAKHNQHSIFTFSGFSIFSVVITWKLKHDQSNTRLPTVPLGCVPHGSMFIRTQPWDHSAYRYILSIHVLYSHGPVFSLLTQGRSWGGAGEGGAARSKDFC